MMILLWILAILVGLVLAGVLVWRWRSTAEPRLVRCPDDGTPRAVEVSPWKRFWNRLRGSDDYPLRDCSRWPEKADCTQPCRTQIAEAPDGCRVVTLLEEFYRDHDCALCGRSIDKDLHKAINKPGLLSPDGHVLTWMHGSLEELPGMLSTHQALCWDCAMVQKVYEEHPELVTERPARPAAH